jgi:LPXTG-motif cell wall-anchored protein
VALGALLTGSVDQFTIAERGTVLGGIVAVLAGIAYFGGRRRKE